MRSDDTIETSPSLASIKFFVLAPSPYESPGTRVTNRAETETETYELPVGSTKTPLGTSSSPVAARTGTGISVGGVAGTASGKVYIQMFKPGITPHYILTKVGFSNAISSCLIGLVKKNKTIERPPCRSPKRNPKPVQLRLSYEHTIPRNHPLLRPQGSHGGINKQHRV